MGTAASQKKISRARARGESAHIVEFFEIELPDETILRLTGYGESAIGFGGAEYTTIPLQVTGFAWAHGGNPARPEMRIGNRNAVFARYLAKPYMVGGTVRRIVTFLEECDAPHGTGNGGCFTPEVWSIERIARLNSEDITITLAPAAGFDGRSLPLRVMLKDLCQHRYRVWDAKAGRFDYTGATCPYTKAACFDENGAPTTDRAKDRCSLRLESGCKKRFARTLPYLGFPGMGEFG